MKIFDGKKVNILTVGCRLNQADSALLAGRLTNAGFEMVKPGFKSYADVIIINSCAVTSEASRKSRQAARRIRKEHPESCIVVTGCGADTEKNAWLEEDSADIVISNEEKKSIIHHLQNFYSQCETAADGKQTPEVSDLFREKTNTLFPFRSRAFLKIQEGCNSYCSYCIVPYARGRERSREIGEVVSDFQNMRENGFKEIVLTGVNICTYKCGNTSLSGLVRELAAIDGDFRIRLGSTEPHPSNYEIIDVIESFPEKICRFLHLPLQHGTDEILKAMNRKYTVAEYTAFAAEARKRIPNIHIGSDVIVGFPGETEKLFQEMRDLIRKLSFANLHIFSYSKREGTPAASFPNQVTADKAAERYAVLSRDAEASAFSFAKSQIGKELLVLVEKILPDSAEGWSDNYVRVRASGKSIRKNSFLKVIPSTALSDGTLEAN
ncbi:MAG: tRNA (N(6)-L-threonylcarbamoyladenosine(37)-C(2))-methylthiotransferase MtaB [Lentisphaerae bacterium GWF2_45_14]|nr:MAG: tRNA (N(6)-L-threonylcarbamoyladenosine(37)-C(2))-methylthiotransferase MtaB [Lentisphaerae bacterium GWF2_45_14]